MVISFEKLRQVKDSLPSGSMRRIADELGINIETVRNSFGGTNFDNGVSIGVHFEQGPNGGFVRLDNPEIYECALKLMEKAEVN